MGKHTKRNVPLTRSQREPEPQEDLVEFDFLTETDDDILDLDADSIVSEFLPDADSPEDAEVTEAAAAETAAQEPEAEAPEDAEAAEATAEEETAPIPEPEPPKEKEPAPSGKPAAPARKKSPSGKKKPMSAAARAKRERARSKRRFRRGLTAYVLVLLALIIGTLVYEWYALGKSQERFDAEAAEEAARKAAIAEQQAHEKAVYRAPQLAFESWQAGTDADYWTDLWFSDKTDTLDPREAVLSYMRGRFEAAEPFRAMEYTAEQPVYVLKDGAETLARITLTGSELNWNVSNVELLIKGTESASTRVATGSRVFCNGTELSGDYVVSSDSYFKFDPLRDKLENPVSWNTYEVSGLLTKPELTVEPPTGGIITETAEGDFLLCLDAAAGKPYADKATAFVKAYLFYYLSGSSNLWGNLANVKTHLVPGTNAYKTMTETSDGVYWLSPHYNIDTSNISAGDVVIWADNCYSVDVAYEATGVQNGQNDVIAASMRIYFQKINGNFVISDFEIL